MDFGDATDKLMMADTYVADVGAAGAAFMLCYIVDNLLDRFVPVDNVPDFAAGLVVIGGIEMTGFAGYERQAQAGAGVYVADQLARQFNVRSTVTSVGGA